MTLQHGCTSPIQLRLRVPQEVVRVGITSEASSTRRIPPETGCFSRSHSPADGVHLQAAGCHWHSLRTHGPGPWSVSMLHNVSPCLMAVTRGTAKKVRE